MRPRFFSLADILLGSAGRGVAATMVVFRRALHGMCSLGRHVISLLDTIPLRMT